MILYLNDRASRKLHSFVLADKEGLALFIAIYTFFTPSLIAVPSDKALPDVVVAPPQAKNLEQRHSISRLLLDGDEAHTTAALK